MEENPTFIVGDVLYVLKAVVSFFLNLLAIGLLLSVRGLAPNGRMQGDAT
jgi:hypothetical protein